MQSVSVRADEKAYRKKWWSWALYDVANSAFWLVIVATIFPFFYQEHYVEAHSSASKTLTQEAETALRTQGASSLALAAGIAMVIVAVLGPILGTIADRTATKKRLLAVFAGMGIVSTVLMYFIPSGGFVFAAVLYALGTIGVAGSMVFYDALLPTVAREKDLDRISSFGFAAGYLGSVLLLILNFVWISKPGWFGLSGPGTAARLAFVSVAIWWGAFTIPLLLHVPEPGAPKGEGPQGNLLLGGFHRLGLTFKKLGRFRQLLLFMIAFWVYSDGVGTIIKMAVPFGYSLHVDKTDLMLALILTQIVGVPFALGFGWLAGKIGAKQGILLGLAFYAAICAGANFMTQTWHFYALAIAVGMVQGGTQALSRSLFATMIPAGQSGEFFGFFSTMEKFAGILGPFLLALLWGGKDPDPRRGIMALAVLFIVGGVLLWRVNVTEGQRAAAEEGLPCEAGPLTAKEGAV